MLITLYYTMLITLYYTMLITLYYTIIIIIRNVSCLKGGANDISLVQWNLSIEDTIGTQLAVLYREVSLIQWEICTQLYVVGTADSVLIREVSLIQSALYREVSLYSQT